MRFEKLLVSLVQGLLADAGVRALVIIVVKIVGDTDLDVGHISQYEPFA